MSAQKRKKLAGNHQKSWLWGRHLVMETVTSGRWIPRNLILSEDLSQNELTQLLSCCDKYNIPVSRESSARLTELCRASDHQGYLARMPEFRYENFSDFQKKIAATTSGTILILDRIQDPHNLGAILRSAEVLGASGLILGTRHQVGITTAVARASAGAINHLPVVQVEGLLETVRLLQELNFKVVGTALQNSEPLNADSFGPRNAILIGNESNGVASELLDACNLRVRIPQSGQLDSLNAAVAAGILLYAAMTNKASLSR
ncbi:MAG: 23S rRNA (guanosine(2251)-2'-O)-methyltransferase RlmB [Planctomycetaceae bacterium]